MKSVFLTFFLTFYLVAGFSQKRYGDIYGGFIVGYKTSNGLGIDIFKNLNSFEYGGGVGITPFNGIKFGLNFRYVFLNEKKLNFGPFASFSITNGEMLEFNDLGQQTEKYKTFPNLYFTGGIAIHLRREYSYHLFSFGYTQISQPFRIEIFSNNTTYEFYKSIEKSLSSGLMFSYSFYLNISRILERR